MGVSVDSLHSHANWARSLGGVSFPLLADFHPKGALAQKLSVYLDSAGITDRATVIIDREGVVRYHESVGPGGKRDVDELVAACEKVDGGSGAAAPAPKGVPEGATVFIKSKCGPSLRVQNALANLKLDAVLVRNVTEDPAALAELQKSGSDQAPCLVHGGQAQRESGAICAALADMVAPVWS